jgi:hypothetical protein
MPALRRQPGHAEPVEQNAAHRVRVQRGAGDPPARADVSKQRSGVPLADGLPLLECSPRAGFDVFAAGQADLPRGRPISAPLPFLVGLAVENAQTPTVGVDLHILDRSGAAHRRSQQQQRAVAPSADGPGAGDEHWRGIASDRAAGFWAGRRGGAAGPCGGPWMAPCAAFLAGRCTGASCRAPTTAAGSSPARGCPPGWRGSADHLRRDRHVLLIASKCSLMGPN